MTSRSRVFQLSPADFKPTSDAHCRFALRSVQSQPSVSSIFSKDNKHAPAKEIDHIIKQTVYLKKKRSRSLGRMRPADAVEECDEALTDRPDKHSNRRFQNCSSLEQMETERL